MKVILLDEIKGKGGEGDVVEVAQGYAENFLFPKKLAVAATKGNLKQLDERRNNIAKREAVRLATANETKAAFEGKTVTVSGSGNVAIYATEKAQQLGAKVVTLSDSTGWIHDPAGIDVALLKQIKEVERGRIKEYAAQVPGSTYTEGFRGIWTIPCDIALPCATQNEITAAEADEIVKGGAMAVAEGANMPSTPEAIAIFQKAGLLFAPAKAANAGGVAVSALEMSQNSMRYSWTFEEVDAKLQGIMVNIFHNINNAAKEYGMEGNLVAGANLAGFKKVSEAMIAQGVV